MIKPQIVEGIYIIETELKDPQLPWHQIVEQIVELCWIKPNVLSLFLSKMKKMKGKKKCQSIHNIPIREIYSQILYFREKISLGENEGKSQYKECYRFLGLLPISPFY